MIRVRVVHAGNRQHGNCVGGKRTVVIHVFIESQAKDRRVGFIDYRRIECDFVVRILDNIIDQDFTPNARSELVKIVGGQLMSSCWCSGYDLEFQATEGIGFQRDVQEQ